MTAQIIQFPELRSCFRCIHHDPWARPDYCMLLDKRIYSPDTALDCNGFETSIDTERGTDGPPV